MSFTVVWKALAEEQLAEIWLASEDRNAVSRTARELEEQLRQRPLEVGESRDGATRVVMQPPLAVHFDVFEDDRLVVVLSVKGFTTHWM